MKHILDYKFCKDSGEIIKIFYYKNGRFLSKKKIRIPSIKLSFINCFDDNNNLYKVCGIKKAKLNTEKF